MIGCTNDLMSNNLMSNGLMSNDLMRNDLMSTDLTSNGPMSRDLMSIDLTSNNLRLYFSEYRNTCNMPNFLNKFWSPAYLHVHFVYLCILQYSSEGRFHKKS